MRSHFQVEFVCLFMPSTDCESAGVLPASEAGIAINLNPLQPCCHVPQLGNAPFEAAASTPNLFALIGDCCIYHLLCQVTKIVALNIKALLSRCVGRNTPTGVT